jgi:acyl-CoA reductase-like NAD-dependent aldehyde dehydrogenase
MAPEIQTTITPHSQQPYIQRTYPSEAELDAHIARAAEAQKSWSKVPLEERIAIGRKFMVSNANIPSECD